MPQQLIYTSAPRGIVAGRSGYCTVARSALLREALMLQLEKFCYYQHLSLSGGQERPIFASRIVDIRGARFHVLSRLQDAGLDFTGRTNFIAHHLVFAPEEIRQYPAPPVILRDWPGWQKSWTAGPQLFENETWADLAALNARPVIPARTWQQVTGDAANGYGLLEARPGASFRVDDEDAPTVLQLFAESLALLEIRDPRRDPRVAAWAYTFTTSMQEQDNPADFRWRCLHADNPAAIRFATPDCRPLSAVRALKVSAEEAEFARTGPQPPHFVIHPHDQMVTEGEPARFKARAEGVPSPAYQWFTVDRAERRQPLAGETQPELVITDVPLGISRFVVRASNSTGDVASVVAKLSVEEKARLAPTGFGTGPRSPANASHQKSPEEIERQRLKLAAQKEQEDVGSRRRNKVLVVALTGIVTLLVMALIASAGVLGWLKFGKKPVPTSAPPKNTGTTSVTNVPHSNQTVMASTSPASPAPAPTDLSSQPLRAQDSLPLAAPWLGRTIGWSSKPTPPRYDYGTFLLSAQPGAILPNQIHDAFFFTSQEWSNNVELVARFSKAGRIGKSRCGLMLRALDRDDAPFVFVGCSESSVFWMQRSQDGSASVMPAAYPIPNGPVYLRFARQETNCSGDFSFDGTNWEPLCVNAQIDLNGPGYLVGFALCSGSEKEPVHVDLDNVAINGIKQ